MAIDHPTIPLAPEDFRGEDPITLFGGDYRFLSNFADSPMVFMGNFFPTVEHAYQAFKAETEDEFRWVCDPEITPGEAKRRGRQVTMRDDFEETKVEIMLSLQLCKFSSNPSLATQLMETGDRYLEEGNTWGDTIWGTVDGVGHNYLGKCIMTVRDMLSVRSDRGLLFQSLVDSPPLPSVDSDSTD